MSKIKKAASEMVRLLKCMGNLHRKFEKRELDVKNIKLSLRFLCLDFCLNHTNVDEIGHIAQLLGEKIRLI